LPNVTISNTCHANYRCMLNAMLSFTAYKNRNKLSLRADLEVANANFVTPRVGSLGNGFALPNNPSHEKSCKS
jgi:hypothetical protein